MITGPSVLLLLAVILLCTSCFEEDEIVPVHEPGELETLSVDLGESYHTQAFLDLSSYAVASSNSIYDWDMAFACGDDEWHILLNSAKMMLAGNSLDTSFYKVLSGDDLEMDFDHSSGNPDSTAIGSWYEFSGDTLLSRKHVYIIDRGMGPDGLNMGSKKITLDLLDGKYRLRHADLDGSGEQILLVEKDPGYNFVYISFETGLVPVAPVKEEWSLKISRYSTMLLTDGGENYPYLVTGVLLSPNGMSAAVDSSDFFSIELQDTLGLNFSTDLDIIGYDWKYYSFDNEMYTIVPDNNYIIKNHEGYFYKLRFIGFYDEFGVKGTITLEVAKL